jgi:hypothetical protein
MKINEVCSPLKIYLATVRVVLKNATTTARTTIHADSSANAYLMLTHLYGVGNVVSLSEVVVNESPQTDQIHLDELCTPQVIETQAPHRKTALKRSSQVVLHRQRPLIKAKSQAVTSLPVADPIKHELVRDKLTNKFVRQSNIVKPTEDDIRVAVSRAETALKRADLDYKKCAKQKLRLQQRK